MSDAGIIRYIPGIVPNDPASLEQFLADELYRIAGSLPVVAPSYVMYNQVNPIALNVTEQPLVNYPSVTTWAGGDPGACDLANGIFTVEADGVYRASGWVSGENDSPTKSEQIELLLRDLDSLQTALLGVTSVVSTKTNRLAVTGTVPVRLKRGARLQLFIRATDDLGTLTAELATFEILGLLLE